MLLGVTCPSCGQPVSAPEGLTDRRVRCAACGTEFVVPEAEAGPPASASEPTPPAGEPRKRTSLVVRVLSLLLLLLAFTAAVLGGLTYWGVIDLVGVPDGEWKEFRYEDVFSAQFPGEPTTLKGTVPGGALTMNFTLKRHVPDVEFNVSVWGTRPATPAEQAFEEFYQSERKIQIDVSEGKLLGETDLTLDGWRGKEFQVEPRGKNGMIVQRVYANVGAPGKVYVVSISAKGAGIKPDSPIAQRFLNSMHLKPIPEAN